MPGLGMSTAKIHSLYFITGLSWRSVCTDLDVARLVRQTPSLMRIRGTAWKTSDNDAYTGS
jgi:hypothetical protein